jgi:hypothetical protein
VAFRERAAFRFLLIPFHHVRHGLDIGDEQLVADGLRWIRERDAPTT